MPRILIIDDEKKMVNLLDAILTDEGYEVECCYSGTDGIKSINENEYDIVLTDLKMKPVDGLEVLEKAKKSNPETVVIMMTAFASAETAVQAMKNGAYDYLIKPFKTEELLLILERVLETQSLKEENEELKKRLGEPVEFPNIIGESRAIKEVFHLINKVAGSNTTVLLRGESGTGKELAAQAIHAASPRSKGPLITVNCGALPETLLESELFGHEKGSFTGAIKQKKGRFELANGGTIFLDEIGDISPAVQVKLLRVLQEREFERVGGMETLKTDARIIAATNRDLETMRGKHEFRDDLYFRLSVFPIYLPNLKTRVEDIELLVKFFLRKHNADELKISEEVWEAFENYEWPGNIRELENVIERAVIIKHGDGISIDDLPPNLQASLPGRMDSHEEHTSKYFVIPDEGIDFEELERDMIIQALKNSDGSKTKAAQLLGYTRRKLYSRMEILGIKSEE